MWTTNLSSSRVISTRGEQEENKEGLPLSIGALDVAGEGDHQPEGLGDVSVALPASAKVVRKGGRKKRGFGGSSTRLLASLRRKGKSRRVKKVRRPKRKAPVRRKKTGRKTYRRKKPTRRRRQTKTSTLPGAIF